MFELVWDLFGSSFRTRLGDYISLGCCYCLISIEEAFKRDSRVLERAIMREILRDLKSLILRYCKGVL